MRPYIVAGEVPSFTEWVKQRHSRSLWFRWWRGVHRMSIWCTSPETQACMGGGDSVQYSVQGNAYFVSVFTSLSKAFVLRLTKLRKLRINLTNRWGNTNSMCQYCGPPRASKDLLLLDYDSASVSGTRLLYTIFPKRWSTSDSWACSGFVLVQNLPSGVQLGWHQRSMIHIIFILIEPFSDPSCPRGE